MNESRNFIVKKFIVIFAILFFICCPIVSGLTESGEISYEALTESTSVTTSIAGGSLSFNDNFNISCVNAASINGLQYLVYYSNSGFSYDAGKTSGQTRFTSAYGDGWIGYNIITGANGFVFVQFDQPIQTTGSEFISFHLTYDYTYFNNLNLNRGPVNAAVQDSSGVNMAFLARNGAPSVPLSQYEGKHFTNVINKKFKHQYDVTLDEDTNIVTGNIIRNVDGYAYPSKFYIYDVTNSLIISDSTYQSNDLPFMIFKSPLKISFKDVYNNWHNTSYLLYPEIEYYLTFNPSSSYTDTNISVTLSSDEPINMLSNLKYIQMDVYLDGYNGNNKFFAIDKAGNYANYLKNSSGYWGRYTGEGYVFGSSTTFPNNINLAFPASGNWTIYTTIEDITGQQYSYVHYYDILGSVGKYKLAIYPVDGYDGSFVSGSEIDLQDTQTGIWTNKTVNEIWECAFPVSTAFYKFVVYAPDDTYTDVNQGVVEGIFILDEDIATTVTLFPKSELEISGDITNSTVYIGVKEPEQLKPIYGATVTVGNQIQKTNTVGIATFTLLNGTPYKAVATAQGYTGTSVSFTPNTAVYSFDIALGSSGAVPTGYGQYLTPVPSPTRTPIPVITPSAWAEGNASVCGAPYDETSLIEFFKNLAACNGFKDAISQSLLIAGAIILFAMGIGYSFAKVIGGGIGAIVGFVFAWAIGLIPFFVFVALIILLICIAAALLAVKASSGG